MPIAGTQEIGPAQTVVIEIQQSVQALGSYLANLQLWTNSNFSITVNGVQITLTPQQQTQLQAQYDTLKSNLNTLILSLP